VIDVAGNLEAVQARIATACAHAGRDPATVRLIAVSKLQPIDLIRAAYVAGHRDFGENYAQELRDKARALAELPDLRWHAIGPLQTNKAKYVAAVAHTFHALDRLEVAEELGRRRVGAPLRCLLEVNVAGEASKSGVSPDEAPDLLERVRRVPNLEVVGLMNMPPLEGDAAASAESRTNAAAAQLGLPERSMGTTGDFESAIAHGATLVRVGTAIFGPRPAG
jgi:PLP dependent protein